MSRYSFQPSLNFLGLPEESANREESHALLLPIPYEATVSYRGGAKDGPRAILEASTQVELYDASLDSEPALDWGIHTLPAIATDVSGPEAMVDAITACLADNYDQNKLFVALGGEHTVSIGVARGLARHYPDFVTVQLDAHADLRESYEGSRYSHACAARRILEISPICQLGIRSLDISESRFIRDNPAVVTSISADATRRDRTWLKSLEDFVTGRNVFLTLDLDVLDPSLMPSTGTPEPGGLLWHDVLEIVQTVVNSGTVVAFDCVELAPIPGFHAPNFLAAKLVYKIIGMILVQRADKDNTTLSMDEIDTNHNLTEVF